MGASERIGLVASGDAYFRLAVGAILTRQFGFSDVLETSTLDQTVEMLSGSNSVCTALIDLSMDGVKSSLNIKTLRERYPNIRLGVISTSNSRRDILLALEAGVHGYMPKQLSVAELTAAFQVILNGGIYVPPCLATVSSVAEEPIRVSLSDEANTGHALTARQKAVLDLLVQGKSNKEIALALNLGEGTVKIHVAAIFRHFGVNNRAAAAVAGTQPGSNHQWAMLEAR